MCDYTSVFEYRYIRMEKTMRTIITESTFALFRAITNEELSLNKYSKFKT